MRRSVEAQASVPDDDDPGDLTSILGFHIRLAHGAVYRHFSETFAELRLSQKAVSVLWLVNDHPGIGQSDLSRRLRMDRATTMGIVNRLQGRMLLRRDASANDRRKQALFIEHDGAEVLAEAKKAVLEHEHWLKGRFSQHETAKLIELLKRIHRPNGA